ncbi:MAG TPA: kelch repeat-containing protein [Jiangellaceae bacterium]
MTLWRRHGWGRLVDQRVLGPTGAAALAVALTACTAADDAAASNDETPSDSPSGEPSEQSVTDLVETLQGEWTLGQEAAASHWRTEVGVAAWNGRIWVVGGFVDGLQSNTNSVLVYDPASDSWDEGPSLPGGVDHTSVVGGDRLYVIGGYGQGSNVWVLNSAGDGWDPGPALPAGRAAGAAVWDGSRIVYGGGVGEAARDRDEVLVLDDDGWHVAGRLSEARNHLGAATDGAGTVWFLAGRVTGNFGSSNVATVDLFDGDQVTYLGDVPTPRSGGGGFFVPDLGGCYVGGESSGFTFTETECVDRDGTVRILPDLPEGRHGIGAGVVLDDRLYVLTGGPRPNFSFSGSVRILDLATLR